MTLLIVENSDNKFVNNIRFTQSPKLTIGTAVLDGTLYDIYYKHKFSAIIFMSSKFRPEVRQFILEYAEESDVKIFIYHDILTVELFDISDKIIHLVDQKYKYEIKHKTIRYVPQLVNKELYNTNNAPKEKQKAIVCFLDGLTSIPSELSKYLYPNTLMPIKLFNNANIKHHQNLGMLDEPEKAQILKQAEYYIAIDDHYAPEAISSGCKALDMNELSTLDMQKYKHKKNYQSYTNYIENLIYDK